MKRYTSARQDAATMPETAVVRSSPERVVAHTRAWVAELEPLIAEHAQDWHMLQPVFDADLDQERLARSHARDQQGAHEENA